MCISLSLSLICFQLDRIVGVTSHSESRSARLPPPAASRASVVLNTHLITPQRINVRSAPISAPPRIIPLDRDSRS